MDPKLTLFRPGSVSKLFTWTAVMQQVEQGKIDLDADINQYLDFKIDGPGRQADHHAQSDAAHGRLRGAGQGHHLRGARRCPPTTRCSSSGCRRACSRPGTTPAYSNYGASLAGYIVQRLSGESFDDYIDKHIFAPLDMKHSSFRQPLPANLAPLMSKGYPLASEQPRPFEIVGPAPAGSLSSSGEDMAHFMIAHLQNGEYHGKRILKAETAQTDARQPAHAAAAAEPHGARLLRDQYQRPRGDRHTWATPTSSTPRCTCS